VFLNVFKPRVIFGNLGIGDEFLPAQVGDNYENTMFVKAYDNLRPKEPRATQIGLLSIQIFDITMIQKFISAQFGLS